MPRITRRRPNASRLGLLVIVPSIAASLLAVAAPVAMAQDFSCRASLIRATLVPLDLTVEPVVANEKNAPCDTDDASLIGDVTLPGGLGEADLLFARTDTEKQKFSSAESGVAVVNLTIPGAPAIRAEVLTARAAMTCPGPTPSTSGTVVGLFIDGQEVVNLDEPQMIPIGVGTVYLNRTINGPNEVTRQALEVDVPGVANVVVSEAIADYTGNPSGGGGGAERFPGWMTGGGYVAEAGSKWDHNDEGTVEPGTKVQHSFSIDCFFPTANDTGRKDHLGAQFFDETAKEHASFKTELITDARCSNDPEEGGPRQPRSRFNTIEGEAVGTCRSQGNTFPATIDFRFTDEGEPGVDNDEAYIKVSSPAPPPFDVLCNYEEDGRLDGGNHQAHQTKSQFNTASKQRRARR